MLNKIHRNLITFLLLCIITIPAIVALLNNQHFLTHDDQHIARLYLLVQALLQGNLYPRWVDILGFGFGYPLFNFYPPLIYYLGALFHGLGASYIWSIKLVFILGFIVGAYGVYQLTKRLTCKIAGLLAATLYTYFFYHAVLIYVRGALAEFIAMAILPFVFLNLDRLYRDKTWKNTALFGISLTFLILCHPLIAFPTFIYIVIALIFYASQSVKCSQTNKINQLVNFLIKAIIGILIGLAISSFFWLPSLVERNHTMTDLILTNELASYKIHYINPQQFIYSPWGFGGSAEGLNDGMTFQLGKIHLYLLFSAVVLSLIYLFKKRKKDQHFSHFYFILFMFIFSIFMTLGYSSIIWDNIKYLWYMQFPWRFLTFVGVFISIIGGYCIFFLQGILDQYEGISPSIKKNLAPIIVLIFILSTVLIYQKYFHPDKYVPLTDRQKTSFNEIAWNVSRTSYEFVPKGVKKTKTALNTTIPDIRKNDIPKSVYEIIDGKASSYIKLNLFTEKILLINAETDSTVRINTYYFPGWNAYLNNRKIRIYDNNDYKLITVKVPKGQHQLKVKFENTPVRTIGEFISLIGLIVFLYLLGKKSLN
ncbi:hypothetical protein A3H78_01360 [Candidatus Roizmanbacteria bacterium RIFCSPLOWO2_02_FULL_36_11]|uniref:Membrane protein 6-pyruvoyl-tetrahydropterin synthase-related domain-containing protein n=1 Tax=Candidatus Roizmanbacteria bacterium RIFCSPLOWO2_02_FULL_36_11 TaxID=1802071 RepID=A0A1F7JFA8_9BACT|nr:MAG: hypothetical protein A3H78_01360 [Candidatus Roizmanbacteria bacterium RIFCSPLOWO2_02_FULL_36_11]